MARLTWINQAGCRIDAGSTSLVLDPWIAGRVFNGGWDVLVPSPMTAADFNDVTHIWFSHEHPDHFSPEVLQGIDANIRHRITVMFRRTDDHRVAKYCGNLGYTVVELPDRAPYAIGDQFRITCHEHGTLDSYLFCEFEDLRLLNVNDCIFVTQDERRHLLSPYRDCDVLMCQFGYAEKIGNRDDIDARKKQGEHWINELIKTVDVVRPKYTIPCANFKFFCRTDNAYMNAGAPTVDQAYGKLLSTGATIPVVLAPGDVWHFSAWDSKAALETYADAWRRKESRLHSPPSTTLSAIMALNDRFIASVQRYNSSLVIRSLSHLPRTFPFSLASISIWVDDLAVGGLFDLVHGFRTEPGITSNVAEIEMTSDSLAHCLAYDYGLSAIVINGCFQARPSAHQRMFNMAHIRMLNSSKRSLDMSYIVANALRAVRMIRTREIN